MKIRGYLTSQMTIEELRELSVMAGKAGAKARAEIFHRTGEVVVKPANAVKAARIPKPVKPKPQQEQAPDQEAA